MAFEVARVQDIELAAFKNNNAAVSLYLEAKEKLRESGIINFLRIFARPYTVDRGANVNSAAYSAAFTEGYAKALDDLMYFDEMYLQEKLGKKKITADFGGVGLALKKGDLTEKDIGK